ncbi:olfactory receptor 2G3-like [Sorex araneus]|uniref:olfactory receptor 2G3-like n=1 Tax=Sorex araneus TaxID=42254 RepID=UPI0024337620|nr:olfactory receptor 2G3-like [Sorex araneus]
MEQNNETDNGYFVLLGFSDQPQLELILFVVVLVSYLLTIVGNSAIILVSLLDAKLQTPMYYFLTNLSFIDLGFTTSIIPQLLWNLKGPSKTITWTGCVIQLYVSLSLGSMECVLLTIMAFDRYVAVCKPLNYTTIMHPSFCKALAGVAWVSGIGNSLIVGTITLRLPRCGRHHLDHFLCEVPDMVKLACVNTQANEVQLFFGTLVLILIPMLLILLSYGLIVQAVVKLKSAQAWRKALGTCGSHLIVVSFFFGTSSVIYIKPQKYYGYVDGKFLTLFYAVVTPTLNPLIYTLRNKDVKGALRRLLRIDEK